MDTVFPDSVLRSRAINNETIWHAAYALIIAAEAFRFYRGRRRIFRHVAIQSMERQEGAFRFVTMILGALIFVSLPDGDLA